MHVVMFVFVGMYVCRCVYVCRHACMWECLCL